MILRAYTPSDAEALAEIYRDAVRGIGPQAYTEEQVTMWALYPDDLEEFRVRMSRGLTLVAEERGKAVAFGQLEPNDHLAFIYCSTAYSRRGIASVIYSALEAHAFERGVTLIHTEASRISRPFFEKRGFATVEVERVLRFGVEFERFRMQKRKDLPARSSMQNQESPVAFDQAHADAYDQRFAKLAPLRDALHLLISAVLADLPAEARILCVGAGTGHELIYLARKFPQWRFAVVEPSAPMLEVCRRKAAECGITSRCVFHEGYLDSLPPSAAFDAATSLLVSQFILAPEARAEFFRAIAARLRPGGFLVSADLASDLASASYQGLLEVWLRLMRETGSPPEQIEKLRVTYGRDVAVLPLEQLSALITSGGFEPPVLFLQTCLIHAWYTQRTPTVA